MMIYPGPERLDPDQCPDGLVAHVYAIPTERLLFTRHLTFDNPGDGEADALEASVLLNADEEGTCIVFFDGDTGHRIQGLT